MKCITNKMLEQVSEVTKETKFDVCFTTLEFYSDIADERTTVTYTISLVGRVPERCKQFSGATFEEAFVKLTYWAKTQKES